MPDDLQSLNNESSYNVNTAFKSLTRCLPKKNRYNATKIYQKTA